ncbi:hypothetical protein AYK26_02235 [Euryarchaeota archaeon SM23-78]|nr:MAG: hypothetical protein AYK26_02235 [Euryarchaeota archaeon SM23-78]MBW3000900.1 class I SAM-dependent methyltransferase [Candidatus Woesearchaeota archaeon]
MSKKRIIYKNQDAESMLKWRSKEADVYLNLERNFHQILFIHKYKNLSQPRRILEYGCAFGDLLAIIQTLNKEHTIYGVEVVEKVAHIAESQIGQDRVFIQSCEKKVPVKSSSIDIAFSFDMIEHVGSKKKIKQMLKEINRVLKDDGLCIIVSPNFSWIMKLIYNFTGNNWMNNKEFHPNQYTMKQLIKEVEEELEIKNIDKGFDLNFFTRILSKFGVYKHLCIVAGKK